MTHAARTAAGASAALAAMLVLAGHPVGTAVAAAAIVLVQVASGVAAWSAVDRGRSGDPMGTVAVGAALGVAASCASSVALVATSLRPVAWALPAAAAVAASPAVRRALRPVTAGPSRHDWTWLAVVLVAGLATEWTWMFPALLALCALAWGWSAGPFRGWRRSRARTRVAMAAASALLAAQWAVIRVRSPYWVQFRQSVLDIPDHSFFDALARGTARWGAAGTDIVGAGLGGAGYHWLSYHWAGSIVLATGADSPVLASHLVQVVLGAVALALVRTVAVRLGASSVAGNLAALACATMVAAPLPILQALVAYSPSHVAGLAMVLAVVVVADPGTRAAPPCRLAAVALLSAAAVGMKATSLILLGAAAAVALVGRPRADASVALGRRLAMAAAIAAPSLASFAFFFGRRLGNSADTALIPFDVVSSDGPLAAGGNPPALVALGTVAILSALGCAVAGLLLVRRTRLHEHPTAVALLLGAAGLVATGFVYVGSRIGVNYFFDVAIAVSLPVAAAAASRAGRAGPALGGRAVAAIAACALVVQVAWSNAFYRVDPAGGWGGATRSLLMLAPAALALVVAASVRGGSTRRMLSGALAAMLVPAASFVAWVPRHAVVQLRAASGFDPADAYSGRPEYRAALAWLRRVSAVDDVVATNRFCSDDAARYPGCYASWSIVAATTGRRVLVEIPEFAYFVTPEMAARVEESIAFVDAPSSETAAKLATASVSWVYVDKAVTDARSWEPWARIEYENDRAAVLRLLP